MWIRSKRYGSTTGGGSGSSGTAGGAADSIQYNNGGSLDGFGEVEAGDSFKILGAFKKESASQASPDYYEVDGPTQAYQAAAARAFDCDQVVNGPVDATYIVTATLAAKEPGANKGGAIIVAAVFHKANDGTITKIGADQNIMAAVSNLTGALTGVFSVVGNAPKFTASITVVNAHTSVGFKTVVCGSTL